MTQPYTYLIGWPEHNLWYYGVRYANNCNPSEFWVNYKTSSKHVKDFIAEYGDPSIKQIRKVFNNRDKARLWENKVLKRLKVINESKWLNKTDNKSIEPLYGINHPNYHRRGANSPIYGIKKPKIAEIKKQEWLLNNPMHNELSKAKSIEKRSGNNHHMKKEEIRSKVSGKNNWLFKKPGELEKRRQQFIEMNKARTGKKFPKKSCPLCSREIGINAFHRHYKKCKEYHH